MRDDGIGLEDEENFEEALRAVNTALEHTSIPTNVTAILSDPKCLTLTSTSDDFWVLARALKDFVDGQGDGGSLPLRGSIPDMFSDSKRYIQLQNIYRERANADVEEVFNRVQHHLEAIGRQSVSWYKLPIQIPNTEIPEPSETRNWYRIQMPFKLCHV